MSPHQASGDFQYSFKPLSITIYLIRAFNPLFYSQKTVIHIIYEFQKKNRTNRKEEGSYLVNKPFNFLLK